MGRIVLVTGVARYLGGRFARLLSNDPAVERVIGVDVVPPSHDIGRTGFVRADIRNPVIGRIIDHAGVDTVVHMSVIATPIGAGAAVRVVAVEGLVLEVEPPEGAARDYRDRARKPKAAD